MSAAAASPAKKVKKASKPKVPAAHPTYAAMVASAIGALKERGGSSKIAIAKYINANYKVGNDSTKVNSRVKIALKSCVKKGSLKQVKGTGASGSFKLGEKKPTAEKKPKVAAKKVNKPKAAATTPKKAAGEKKAKSPKKTAKKAAAKPKKVKTPKKPAAKKPAAKKPAAKKPAVKKAAKKPAKK
ncbi:histone H1-beta, late embryonic-like [Pecten maximus]|uniref:histone H1-beta, late embryonic-like n=1 Tax=Pecten maximus TaxID=6579 RepID=UPI00145827AA|nr:histone H1-beta, late embryonic-like [Pecten maximus]